MICVIDTESTIFKKGNPFARRNRLVYVGTYNPGQPLSTLPSAEFRLQESSIVNSEWLVFFNAKFDLHWLRRHYGWYPSENQRVWCCQLAHFLLTAQKEAFPSLEQVREHHGLTRATTKGSPDYWARGIDTPDIPKEIVLEDLKNDLLDTYAVYCRQRDEFRKQPKLYNLFRLSCSDLLVLADMEYNGLYLNCEAAAEHAGRARVEINEIEGRLRNDIPAIPINFDSPEHISAYLYGGTIKEDKKEMVGVFMSGLRTGQPRYKHTEIEHTLPRQCEPLENTSFKKEGYWSTDESIIRQLSGAKDVRELLLRRSKLSKELDYLDGLPALIDEMDWDGSTLHSSFNQCVAATGRLSSSKPNVQNLTDGVLSLIESVYDR